MKLTTRLSAGRVTWVLASVAVLLTVVSFAAQSVDVLLGSGNPASPLPLFFVGNDQSVPSWYASVILLLCSVLLAVITHAERGDGAGRSLPWGILAAVFLYLSVDEGVGLHERMGPLGGATLEAAGLGSEVPISRTWVIPAAALVLVFVLAYARFFLALPGRIRALFLVAGALFVGGALGMEVLTDLYVYLNGGTGSLTILQNVARTVLLPHVEELLEMLGVVVFVHALLLKASSSFERYEFVLGGHASAEGMSGREAAEKGRRG